MIHVDSWYCSCLIVRGEILGFVKHEPLRKHLPRIFSLIKNEDRQKSPADQKRKSLLDFHIFITSAVRESICDVVLSSTRQHDPFLPHLFLHTFFDTLFWTLFTHTFSHTLFLHIFFCTLIFAHSFLHTFFNTHLFLSNFPFFFHFLFKSTHVVNNDTILHAAHTCTFAFSTQFWSSVVSVLILSESCTDAHAPQWLKKKIHGTLWHKV